MNMSVLNIKSSAKDASHTLLYCVERYIPRPNPVMTINRASICTAPCHSALCKTLMRSEPSGKRKTNAKIMINACAAGALLPSVVISSTILAY
jgi:hypothetical protein